MAGPNHHQTERPNAECFESLSIPRRPTPVSNSQIPERHTGGRVVSRLPCGETVEFTKVKESLIVGPSDALVFAGGDQEFVCCVDSSLLPSIAPITFLPEVLACPGMMQEVKERVIDDPVLFLAGQGSRAPFHWPHDALTRLLAFERCGESARLLVPSYQASSRFIQESLQLLGIPEERIEHLHPNERIRAREVWISEDLAPHEPKLNALLGMLRTRMFEAVGCDPSRSLSRDEGRNIYISRQGAAAKRGVQNGEEFRALAQKFGFQEHRMENLSLRDQIRLAAETTRVLAPHGAGLFNTLYMPGGEVVELFPVDATGKDTNMPCWGRLLDVHAAQGRSVSWRAIESAIVRTSEKELDLFSIIADLSKAEAALQVPHAAAYNTWTRIKL